MEPALHNLCDSCSQLRFRLHGRKECEELKCPFVSSSQDDLFKPLRHRRGRVIPEATTHSATVVHSSSYKDLVKSANDGCHFCTLLASALWESRVPVQNRAVVSHLEPGSVALVLVNVVQEASNAEQELTVICRNNYSVLGVTDLPDPSVSCAGTYTGTCWRLKETGSTKNSVPEYFERDTKFYARCVSARGIYIFRGDQATPEKTVELEGDIPKLINYSSGQIVNVFEERDDLWLAGFTNGVASSHIYGHPRFGWVRKKDFVPLIRPVHPGCACGKGVWEPPLINSVTGGETSYIDPNPASEELFLLIRTWLDKCIANHSACMPKAPGAMPTRLLDVGDADSNTCNLRTDFKSSESFATLSYRWGQSIALTTTLSTLPIRMAGINLGELPHTLRHAVLATRWLGLRYVWIDALCIIQDSAEDWERESANMANIYANAYVNLSADRAPDTEAGFLNPRCILELRSCKHPALVEGTDSVKVVCPILPRPDQLFSRDEMNSRGWILQERALSKRTIHFGVDEIYWECLGHSATEREPEGFQTSKDTPLDYRSQLRIESWITIKSGLNYLQNYPAEELVLLGDDFLGESRGEEARQKWVFRNIVGRPKVVGRWTTNADTREKSYDYITIPNTQPTQISRRLATCHLWYMLVEEYSLRNLTKFSDRLPALSGLAQVFASSVLADDRYVAGLWKTDIINGLCWKRTGNVRPPTTQSSSSTGYTAPSFSWASLDAPVAFSAERGSELPVGMTVVSPFQASVLDTASTPTGVDPFGRISEACIKMQSHVISFKVVKELHPHIRPMFDAESTAETLGTDDRLLCLSLQSRITLSNNPSHYNRERKSCLLILPEESGPTAGGSDSATTSAYKRVGFLHLHVDVERKGKPECPDCDACQWIERLAKADEPKTDEGKAARREKQERDKRAIGYGEWQLKTVVLV